MLGDGADGPNRYRADFSASLKHYVLTAQDQLWTRSLLRNLREKQKPTLFVRTDLALQRDGKSVSGLLYQCIEKPQYFYCAEGDVLLDLKHGWIYNPGVGGFSMHSPKSREFIVCLNFQRGGVPFIRHSSITRGVVWWFADAKLRRLSLET
jgi:hypothetical protein